MSPRPCVVTVLVPDAAVQEPARGGARGADHLRRLAPVEGPRIPGVLPGERVEFWLGLATWLGVITLDVLPGPRDRRRRDAAALHLPGEPAARRDVSAASPACRAPTAMSGATPTTNRCPVCSYCDSRRRSSTPTRTHVCDCIKKLVGADDPLPRAVIIDTGANDSLDITSAEMFEAAHQDTSLRPGSTSRSPRYATTSATQPADPASSSSSAGTGSSARSKRPLRPSRSPSEKAP